MSLIARKANGRDTIDTRDERTSIVASIHSLEERNIAADAHSMLTLDRTEIHVAVLIEMAFPNAPGEVGRSCAHIVLGAGGRSLQP